MRAVDDVGGTRALSTDVWELALAYRAGVDEFMDRG